MINAAGTRLAMCSACEGCPTAQCGAGGCTACPVAALPLLTDGEVMTMAGTKAKVCRPAGGKPKVRERWEGAHLVVHSAALGLAGVPSCLMHTTRLGRHLPCLHGRRLLGAASCQRRLSGPPLPLPAAAAARWCLWASTS